MKDRKLFPYVDPHTGRFNPGPRERALGYVSEIVRNPDGSKPTLDELSAWAKARQVEIKARRDGKALPKPAHRRSPTVRQMIEAWKKTPRFTGVVEEVGKRRRPPLRPSTVRDYKMKADAFLAFDAWLAAAHPAAVTRAIAQGIYDRLEEAKGLSMARGISAVVSSAWTWAARRLLHGVAVNPWLDLERPMAAARLVVWEDREIVAFAEAADRLDRPELADAVYLGLFTGQRQGDRLALTAAGRDDFGRLLFRQSKRAAVVAVPATPQLTRRLDAAAERRKAKAIVAGYVIVNEQSGAPFKGDYYRNLFRRVRAEAARAIRASASSSAVRNADAMLTKRDQDLRDTAVTWLARAGCTPLEIAAITGHSYQSIHSILRHYLALHPEMADAAIGKLVDWLEKQGMAV